MGTGDPIATGTSSTRASYAGEAGSSCSSPRTGGRSSRAAGLADSTANRAGWPDSSRPTRSTAKPSGLTRNAERSASPARSRCRARVSREVASWNTPTMWSGGIGISAKSSRTVPPSAPSSRQVPSAARPVASTWRPDARAASAACGASTSRTLRPVGSATCSSPANRRKAGSLNRSTTRSTTAPPSSRTTRSTTMAIGAAAARPASASVDTAGAYGHRPARRAACGQPPAQRVQAPPNAEPGPDTSRPPSTTMVVPVT